MSWMLKRLGGRFSRSLRLPTPLAHKESQKALLIHVRESVLFLKEDTIIDSDTRLVGNKEVLGLMERLDRLDAPHDQIEPDLGAPKMTMDQLEDDLRERRNILGRLLKEFREHREVSEWLLNKVEEQQLVIDRIANEVREQREVSEQQLKTLKKWWFLYRAAQIEFAGTQLR